MFAKATKCRFFSVFAVVMLMLCSVATIADADAGVSPYGGITSYGTGDNQNYTVEMSVGQTFTYSNITTNLSASGYGTVTYDWSGTAKDAGIALSDSTLSGQFSTAGEYTGTLTANWTGPEAGTDGKKPTQTATQTITFNVAEQLSIKADVTAYALVGWGTSDTVVEITYTGSGTIRESYTYDKDNTSTATTNTTHFTATHNVANKKITIKPSATLTDADQTFKNTKAGPEYINVNLENSESGDKAVMKVVLYIYDKVAISAPTTHYYTYEGDTTYTTEGFVFNVNYDDDGLDETTATGNITVDADQTVLTKDGNNYKKVNISTTFTNSGDLTGNAQSEDYTATLTVNGSAPSNVDGGGATTSTASATFTLTVYRSLEFISTPALKGTNVTPTAAGSNSITLSSYISGAKSIKFDWNDGTTTESVVTGVSANYAVNHNYAKAGVYLITITATNDVGTTTSKVMYAVGQDSTVAPDTTTDDTKKDSKGFFEEHGFLFIVFLILAALLVYAAFFMGYQIPPVLIAIPICVVLAVLLFCYKDFGGIIDAIKGIR